MQKCAGDRSPRDYAAPCMHEYTNPYRDDPELAPLTRGGRIMEGAVAVMLALLAIYLSR